MAGQRVHPTNPFVEFRKEEVEQSIPARFEQQVATYADRLAVKSRRHELTYGALNRAANRAARAILDRRGGGERPIALLLEHDAPMIVAMLGVLKAGHFYVPLDYSAPRARLAYILEDSQASLLVTNNQNLSAAEELAHDRLPLLNLDELEPDLSAENLGLSLSPDTLTWILYTSGSTGQPTGVVQNHRNVLHFMMNHTNGLHICSEDRLALLHSCSVNAANHDIFTALLNGASLHPLDIKEEGVADLANWLIGQEITYCHVVPTLFRHLVDTLTGAERFPKLRLIRLGAEPARARDVELYKQHFSRGCILVNRLGHSETGTLLWYFIDRETRIDGPTVPVGYGVEDNEILLLDEAGVEVGLNGIGEIAVRSRYLSPGYWRRPDLTRAAFQPDPEGGDERLYWTGDLGRMLPDGCLVHVGRKDSQVRIRGHRIELDEIEIALLDLDAINEAVVVAAEDRSGDQRLVAYIVPRGRPAPTVTTLRSALAERLPDYMIPSAFVTLDALPLAPNGKVNRRALPPPGSVRPALGTPFVAPRTPVEEMLAGIWAGVLGLDEIGVHDEFLALGGDSLLATQVAARLGDAFRMELPLPILLAAPTVADQAEALVREEPVPGQVATIARLRRQIAGMPAEERRARLRDKKVTR
ncbi:MAG: non-ribosomal peptide synthetase [Chloroflexi bacterium]|nr:non-ribosomal peptide synthetase [Chloroflexota bacterium]